MNLLREYIRELLTESIDPKMMELIDRLEEKGWKIKLMKDRVILFNPAGLGDPDVRVNQGTVGWSTPDEYDFKGLQGYGPCLGANIIDTAYAAGGLGPVLYDVAIEASGDKGLASDRFSVSPDATNVWDYYMNNRPDVQIIQMDDRKNSLTPDDGDNCDQKVSTLDVGTKIKHGWVDSSLSKVYKKAGTPVIDELERRGLLVRVK